jgi:hypothetical protein
MGRPDARRPGPRIGWCISGGDDRWHNGHAPPAKADNRLYSSWVTDVSIQRLLETTDLNGSAGGLPSALCSDVLDEILANAFKISGTVNPRPWIGRGEDTTLCVMLTLTNLRGVPYSFRLRC